MQLDIAAGFRRLSVSNLAWPSQVDDAALDLLVELGFEGVELAPSKVFGDLKAIALREVRAYRRRVEGRGLSVSALQAILFGVPGVHLFESPASRERMAGHLRRVAEIAGELGAGACVFGSPTLRDPGTRSTDQALAIAEEFLSSVALDFAVQGVELCFEANPSIYQCRFVTRTQEAFDLVDRMNVPGIAMKLDTGTMFINGEEPSIIRQVERRIGHFHVSEPNLVPIGETGIDHTPIAEALNGSTYAQWISIEMKEVDDWCRAVRRAYRLVHSQYREMKDA